MSIAFALKSTFRFFAECIKFPRVQSLIASRAYFPNEITRERKKKKGGGGQKAERERKLSAGSAPIRQPDVAELNLAKSLKTRAQDKRPTQAPS